MKNFININKTEEETVAEIKTWLKNNFIVIILGIVIGIGMVFGWQYYSEQQTLRELQARADYLSALQGEDIQSIDHPEYQNQLLFLKAKNATTAEQAIEYLTAVESEEITHYIRDIKLAQVYLDQGEYQTALELIEDNPLRATSLHLSGDIYMAMGEPSLALESYTEAQSLTTNANLKNILQIKINDLQ